MEFDQRLDNWARWARPHKNYRRTFSLEGRYKPEASEVWEPEQPHVEVDIKDALEVERAIIGLPKKHKLTLVYCYVYFWTVRDKLLYPVCRKIGINPTKLEEYEKVALVMLENRLKR